MIAKTPVVVLLGLASWVTASAQTTVFADNFNVGGNSAATGFGTDGVNTMMSAPRVTGTATAAHSFQYYKLNSRGNGAYSIAADRLAIAIGTNPAIAILSSDGTTPFDFSTDLGLGSGPAQWGFRVDLQLVADATNSARASITLDKTDTGTIGDRDFGIQLDDNEAGLAAGELGVYFRTDDANHPGTGDINQRIGVLAGRAGEVVTVEVLFNDSGATLASSFSITVTSGSETFTVTDSTIFGSANQWNFSTLSRVFGIDTAPNELSTYDNLEIFTVSDPVAFLGAAPPTISTADASAAITLDWSVQNAPAGATYEITADKAVNFPDTDNTGDATSGSGSVAATVDGSLGDTTFTLEILDGLTVVASTTTTVTALNPVAGLSVSPPFALTTDSAAPVTLDWTAGNLPPGSTYEITANPSASFPDMDETGDPSSGSGSVAATLDGALGDITFTITLRDSGSAVLATADATVISVDPAVDTRYLYFIGGDGKIFGFTGIDTGKISVTGAPDYTGGLLEATQLDYALYQAFTFDPTTGIVYGVNSYGDVVTWPSIADWLANTNTDIPGMGDPRYEAYPSPGIHGASYDPNTGGFYVVYEGDASIDGDIGEYATAADFATNSNAAVTTSVYGGNILNFYYWGSDAPGNTGAATPGATYFQAAGSGNLEGFQSLASYIADPNNRTFQKIGFATGTIAAFAVPFPTAPDLRFRISGVTRNGSGNITDATFEFVPQAGASYSLRFSPDLVAPFSLVPDYGDVTASPITAPVPAGLEIRGFFHLEENP